MNTHCIRLTHSARLVAAAFALLGLTFPFARGATVTWKLSGDGVWTTGTNWTGNTVPTATSDVNINTARTVTLSGTTGIASTIYIINSGQLAVSNGATLSLGSTGSYTLSLDYGGVLSVIGSGTKITSAGGFAINTATVTIDNGAAIEVAGSAYLGGWDDNVSNLNISNGARLAAVGGLSLGAGATTVTLATGGTYSGYLAIGTSGTVKVGTGGIAGVLDSSLVDNNGLLAFNHSDDIVFSGAIDGSGVLTKSGTGVLALTGANTYTGGTTIDGGTLQIGNGGTTGSITGAVTVNSGASLAFNRSNTQTFSNVISGEGRVVQNGSSVLTLSGTNTYSGGTVINSGTLSVGSNANLGATGGVTLSGGTLRLANNSATTFNRAVTVTADSIIAPSRASNGSAVTHTLGTLSIGDNTLTVAHGASFNTNQTGSLIFGATTLSGNATLNLTNVNGTGVGVTTLGAFNDNGIARTLTKKGTATLTLATAATSLVDGTAINLEAGTTNLNNATALGSLANVTLSTGATLALGSAPTIGALSGTGGTVSLGSNTLTVGNASNNLSSSFGGVISGTNGKLTKAGSGTLVLSGANTYTGTTTVSAGTLRFARQTSLYNNVGANWTAANLIVNSGATAAFNVGGTGEFTAANIATLAALGTSTGGFRNGSTLGLDTTNAAGGAFTYGNVLANTNGGANTLGLTKLGTGTLTLTGANTYTGGTTVEAGTLVAGHVSAFGTGTVRVNAGILDLGGFAIANTLDVRGGSLTGLAGYTGTQTVTGNASYTGTVGGAIVVSNGATLNTTGATFTGPTTIGSGGTLGGTGTLAAPVTLGAGSTLSPGNSPGTITFAGGLTLDAGVTVKFELGTVSDLVRVSGGTLTGPSSGTVTINLANSGGFTDGTYTLFDFTGATPDNFDLTDFVFGSTIAGYDYALALDGSTLVLTASVIPEPATCAALLGAGALGLAIIIRRRSTARAVRC